MSNRSSTYVGVVVTVLIVAAISSIGYYQVEVAPSFKTTTTTATSTTQTCTPATCVNVTIISGASGPPSCYNSCPTDYLYGYLPLNTTVVLGVNATVTWTNADVSTHTVTSVTVPTGASTFDSGLMNTGQEFTVTFTTPGTYLYHCTIHSWMYGEVIVEPASGSQNSTTSTAQTTVTTSSTTTS